MFNFGTRAPIGSSGKCDRGGRNMEKFSLKASKSPVSARFGVQHVLQESMYIQLIVIQHMHTLCSIPA